MLIQCHKRDYNVEYDPSDKITRIHTKLFGNTTLLLHEEITMYQLFKIIGEFDEQDDNTLFNSALDRILG